MIYTVSRLQREFGLQFTTAEAIIREQTALARKRYRSWYVLNGIAIAGVLVCNFTPRDSLYHRLDDFLLPLALLFLGIAGVLTQRKAHPLIRAAAQAAASPR